MKKNRRVKVKLDSKVGENSKLENMALIWATVSVCGANDAAARRSTAATRPFWRDTKRVRGGKERERHSQKAENYEQLAFFFCDSVTSD